MIPFSQALDEAIALIKQAQESAQAEADNER